MNLLDENSILPLYKQLYEVVLTKIRSGEYKIGEKIPSEEQLMTSYGVSRVTVRNAIKQLVDENIVVKKHGKGTFVARPVYVESLSAGGSFTESGLQMKKQPSTKVIASENQLASKRIANYLGTEESDELFVVARVRSLDNEPAILEVDYFRKDLDFLRDVDLEKVSLLDTLREHGTSSPHYFDNVIEIFLADDEISKQLKVAIEEPVIKINQTVIDNNDQILYFNEQYIKSEVYKVAIRSFNK